jgi:hypothetical protein
MTSERKCRMLGAVEPPAFEGLPTSEDLQHAVV